MSPVGVFQYVRDILHPVVVNYVDGDDGACVTRIRIKAFGNMMMSVIICVMPFISG